MKLNCCYYLFIIPSSHRIESNFNAIIRYFPKTKLGKVENTLLVSEYITIKKRLQTVSKLAVFVNQILKYHLTIMHRITNDRFLIEINYRMQKSICYNNTTVW